MAEKRVIHLTINRCPECPYYQSDPILHMAKICTKSGHRHLWYIGEEDFKGREIPEDCPLLNANCWKSGWVNHWGIGEDPDGTSSET